MHKCQGKNCGEFLERVLISDGPTHSYIWVTVDGSDRHPEQAQLYVCTSGDCEKRGQVLLIPSISKED